MNIRPARQQDAAMIKAMVRGARLNPLDLAWPRFIVAEEDGQVLGCAQIRPHPGAPELASLVVRPDQRGRGIGSALIQAMLQSTTEDLVLFCRPQLQGYYERFGFGLIGVREAPPSMRARYAVGRLLTQVFAGRPVIMMKKEAREKA